MNALYKNQLIMRMAIVSMIFNDRLICGCSHISGIANGGRQKKAIIMEDVRRYHGILFSDLDGGADERPLPSRNSPQCLHFIASSWISSAQNGHFFILHLSKVLRADYD